MDGRADYKRGITVDDEPSAFGPSSVYPECAECTHGQATIDVVTGVLYCGDNLDVLGEYMPPSSVDLVYLDPPFNSQRTYNLIYKDQRAQAEAFKDYWAWSEAAATFHETVESPTIPKPLRTLLRALHDVLIEEDSDQLAYLTMMTPRLVALHRVLKSTGCLYLHCDPTASHYLKAILDVIFGSRNFLNEVIWKRTGAHNSAIKFGPVHDVILVYAKTKNYTWNVVFQPLPQETADAWYNNVEEGTGRRFNRNTLTAPGVRAGSSGLPWRGIDPTAKGRHWSVPGFAREVIGDLDTLEALDALDRLGRVFWPKKDGGTPMLKMYLDESKGVPAQDVWTDIRLPTTTKERLGYPTQKPLDLLKRIILASSKPGDLVLDPFCGCGTTIEASERHGRRWIGIDIAPKAIEIIEERFETQKLTAPSVVWHPGDAQVARELAGRDKRQFEQWVCRKLRARKREKDRGIDGEAYFRDNDGKSSHVIISVKGGKLKPTDLRDLRGTIEREGASIGVLVSVEPPSKEMLLEAARAKFLPVSDADGPIPRLQLVRVDDDFFKRYPIRVPGVNVTEMPKADGEQLKLSLNPAKGIKTAAVRDKSPTQRQASNAPPKPPSKPPPK